MIRSLELDGIEVMSKNMDAHCGQRPRSSSRSTRSSHSCGNSDSHAAWSVGCCYTDFDAEIRTNAALVAAIKGKKGIAKVNDAKRT